jgi:ribosomal protein S18 acetylase RimI-like enzyme
MNISNCNLKDLPKIFGLYRAAVDYQRAKGYNLWPEFDRSMVETEIAENRIYKITEGDEITCIFSIAYSDPSIWQEKDKEPSIYLHRIATNPSFKGRSLVHLVKKWAVEYARANNRKFLRLDTWGDNENLKQYYLQCGFDFVGRRHLTKEEAAGMPVHYCGLTLSLFEIAL